MYSTTTQVTPTLFTASSNTAQIIPATDNSTANAAPSSGTSRDASPLNHSFYSLPNGTKLSVKARLEIGCAFHAGMSAALLAEKYSCSVQYVYKLAKEADEMLAKFDDPRWNNGTDIIIVDQEFIEATCIVLSVVCQSSLEDTHIAIQMLLNRDISVSTISRIRSEYAIKAAEFTEKQDLSPIKIGANDEIFFGQTPVLTGIDLRSTYIYCMTIAPDRTAETWQLQMMLLMDQHLQLECSISDAGNGLLKGIKDAFPDCHIQIDVFHSLLEMGVVVYGIRDKVYAFLSEMASVEKQLLYGQRKFEKTYAKYYEMDEEADLIMHLCDLMEILDQWMKELLGFPGYTADESIALLNWIADEFAEIACKGEHLKFVKFSRLKDAAAKLKNRIPHSQEYLAQLDKNMSRRAKELGIKCDVFHQAYRMLSLGYGTSEYLRAQEDIDRLLWNKNITLPRVMVELDDILKKTYKASSIVENLNSRLRTLINDMRGLTPGMASLLQLYLNTKPYRRSHVPERVGKSPLELLNGCTITFMEILFPNFRPVKTVVTKRDAA